MLTGGAPQCFAPQLIVLRVITGRAWTRDKSAATSTGLEFTNTAASDKSDLAFGDDDARAAKQLELRLETKRSNPSSTDVDVVVVEVV